MGQKTKLTFFHKHLLEYMYVPTGHTCRTRNEKLKAVI